MIAGDTLSEIAETFNTSLIYLRRSNDLTSDAVKVGQILNIPKSINRPKTVRKASYRVKSGDSLSVIANTFGVSISDILQWNGIQRNSIIQPNQRLTVYIEPIGQ